MSAAAENPAARASVTHRDRLRWTSSPPLVLRRTGTERVHLVQVGGGPLGGDRLALDVDLGPGRCLELRTAAATVVQPGRGGGHATFDVEVALAPGSHLTWRPEPTVVCDGADWRPRLVADVADGAGLQVREQLVLGRSGQDGGRAASGLRVHAHGRALLASTTVVDGADPALSGPGGTAGARSVGTLLLAGTALPPTVPDTSGEDAGVTWAWTALDGPGVLLTALGSVRGVARVLAASTPPPSDLRARR